MGGFALLTLGGLSTYGTSTHASCTSRWGSGRIPKITRIAHARSADPCLAAGTLRVDRVASLAGSGGGVKVSVCITLGA